MTIIVVEKKKALRVEHFNGEPKAKLDSVKKPISRSL